MCPQVIQRTAVIRWSFNFLIGAYVAVIAVIVAQCITYISWLKYMAVYHRILSLFSRTAH